jgi:DNA-binding XRE family transcriptional regulator
MGWTQVEAAARLGYKRRAYQILENDHRTDGKPVRIPLCVALACAALMAGLPPYQE